MGDLAVNQKYSNSYRLDHPDFPDVCRTTFAKGTIKEVQKIQDSPIKVKSLMKVEVEGEGVSDFIPLFYHPKPQYWDDADEGIKATDFNQKGKYFERAWMSLRPGDEVRVMVREEKPFAVIGFDDGVPRIGEDIIKFLWSLLESKVTRNNEWDGGYFPSVYNSESTMVPEGAHVCHLQASKRDYYQDVDVDQPPGPDGLSLQLLHEIEPFNNQTAVVNDESHGPDYVVTDNPLDPYGRVIHFAYYSGSTQDTVTIKEYLIPVGAILYSFHFIIVNTKTTSQRDDWLNLWEVSGDPPIEHIVGESHQDIHNFKGRFSSHDCMIKAGPYSEKLYNELKNGGISPGAAYYKWGPGEDWSSINNPQMVMQDGSINNNDFVHNWKSVDFFSPPWADPTKDSQTADYAIDTATLKVFVRQHTKEELQKAGLWPRAK